MRAYMRFYILGLLVLFAASCKVEFDETMPFYCEEDSDCGGDGFECIYPKQGGLSYCCKDEGFNFQTNSENCGFCGNACPKGKQCSSGVCR
ncbi:MAG: hypothetical protein FWC28_06565 [Proteobacteria bacterium]|nr:hypothetical protein [Cystobacterineae bacterium]MCL2258720.1 hypothetical protein [Cystobacterineae bacterium]MCL2314894.1 hypothetical protein [Pseudomonadota bacterium]